MSLPNKRLYKFGDFTLDVDEKVLLSENSQVSLTPKVFELLLLFVENSGKLITKDEIFEKVWAESFVEEGNLTFTINQLRKLLNDNARQPSFIETIPRRGYRFIAEVEVEPEAIPTTEIVSDSFIKTSNSAHQFKKYQLPIAVTIILLITTIVVTSFYVRNSGSKMISSLLSGSLVAKKITDAGASGFAAISPNGKFVVYSNVVNGKSSLWRLQLDNSEKVQILPPVVDTYSIIAISHDNEFIYFTRRDLSLGISLYRIPVFGGVPVKLVSDTQGVFSLSPDDKQISFLRCSGQKDDYCSLFVIDSDGKNERKLVTKPSPFFITDNQFSPDGKTITFAHGQSHNNSKEFSLSEYNLESGETRPILTNQFFHIPNFKWLADGQALLLAGTQNASEKSKIWLVDKNGQITPITKNSQDYKVVTVSQDVSKIVATEVHSNYNLCIGSLDAPENLKTLAKARSGATFSPSGKIIYAATSSTDNNIWETDADGSNQRQLTNDGSVNYHPIVSPDGKFIFFTSNRSGSNQVWRMNADGSNQIQLTKKTDGFPLTVSADGKMVYFRSNLKSNLWQVPIDGGEETLLFNKNKSRFAFSPDAKKVAFFEGNNTDLMLRIYSVETKLLEKEYPLAEKELRPDAFAWSPDGKFLLYTANLPSQHSFLYLQQIDQNAPRKITDLGSDDVVELTISPDNKQFAFTRGRWDYDSSLITVGK